MDAKVAIRRAARVVTRLVGASSLLACIFVITLWIRSFYRTDIFSLLTRHMLMGITSGPNVITWEYQYPIYDNFSHSEPKLGWSVSESYVPQAEGPYSGGTFKWGSKRGVVADETGPDLQSHEYWLIVRDWPIVVGTLVLPACVLLRWLSSLGRRRRLARGECGNCGYDLRASLDRCPECGTAVEPPPQPGDRRRAGRLKSWIAKALPGKSALAGAMLAGSTVACITVATLSYRGHQMGDVFDFLTPRREIYLISRSGELQFEHHRLPPQPIRQVYESRTIWELEYRHFPSSIPRYVDGGHVLKSLNEVDAGEDNQGHITNTYVRGVGVRDWALIVLAAAFPTAFLARRLIRFAKRKRRLSAAKGEVNLSHN
jgi:hypothetical protein